MKRLAVPAKRAGCDRSPVLLYAAAMSGAHGDRDDPQVKAFVDATFIDWSRCTSAASSTPRRARIRSSSSPTRTIPAQRPGAGHGAPGLPAGKDRFGFRAAARGVRETAEGRKMLVPTLVNGLSATLLGFSATRAGSKDVATELRDAVLTVNSPDYAASCVQVLMPSPMVPEGADLDFRQRTCIQLIHDQKYAPAVGALVGILLAPTRSALQPTPRARWRRCRGARRGPSPRRSRGRPQTSRLGEAAARPGLHPAARRPLSPTGRAQAGDAALAALNAADNNANRTAIVRTLYRYPANGRTTSTFMAVYSRIPPAQRAFGGGNPRLAFLLQAPGLYDTKLTEWLLNQLAAAKEDEKETLRHVALAGAMMLMAPHQGPAVAAAVAKDGTNTEKDKFATVLDVAKRCATDAACYVPCWTIPSAPTVRAWPPSRARHGRHLRAATRPGRSWSSAWTRSRTRRSSMRWSTPSFVWPRRATSRPPMRSTAS